MSKKKFNGTEFINELVKKGWSMDGDKITPPPKNWRPQSIKKSKRTYDTKDHINLKNRLILHPFKTLIEKEFNVEVWPEFQFTSERAFRIDFAIPELMIAIEVDGGIWKKGNSGHSSGAGIKRDQEKTTLLSAHGWAVMRFVPGELLSTIPLDAIRKFMERKANLSFT